MTELEDREFLLRLRHRGETEPTVIERGPPIGASADVPDTLPSDSSPIPGFMEGKGDPATDSTTGAIPGFMESKGEAHKPSFIEELLDPEAYAKKRKEVSAEYSELLKSQIGADAAATQHELDVNRGYESRMEKLNNQIGHSLDNIKPWNADVETAKRTTGLWEQFGSPGFVLAMVASSFTTMPMVSALNAGAAAMNAINQGDHEAYEKAFNAWKDNTELALKRSRLEQEQFNNLSHLRETKLADYRVKLESMLRTNGDERKLLLLQHDMLPEIDEAFGHQFEAADKLAKLAPHMIQNHVLMNALNSDPEWKEALASGDGTKMMDVYTKNIRKITDATERHYGRGGIGAPGSNAARWEAVASKVRAEHPELSEGDVAIETNRLIAESRHVETISEKRWKERRSIEDDLHEKYPEASPGDIALRADKIQAEAKTAVTGNQRAKIESHIGQYDDALKIIDQVDNTINKYVGAAGIAGRAGRMEERLSNWAGGNQSDRVQMERDINQLQLMMPRLLLDISTGRPLSAEEAKIESIVAGLKWGDTKVNTLRAMKELSERLKVLRDRNQKALVGESSVAPPTEKPAEPTHDWSDFPEAK